MCTRTYVVRVCQARLSLLLYSIYMLLVAECVHAIKSQISFGHGVAIESSSSWITQPALTIVEFRILVKGTYCT